MDRSMQRAAVDSVGRKSVYHSCACHRDIYFCFYSILLSLSFRPERGCHDNEVKSPTAFEMTAMMQWHAKILIMTMRVFYAQVHRHDSRRETSLLLK
jgi:hypothetical protein